MLQFYPRPNQPAMVLLAGTPNLQESGPRRWLLATVIVWTMGFGLSVPIAQAACQRSDDTVDVAIGIRHAPGFITGKGLRGRRGFATDLWENIEQELQAKKLIGKTEYIDCPLGGQIEALGSGDLDLVISPLTITSDRLQSFSFTHQYLSSGITIAQRSSSAIDFGYAIGVLKDTLSQKGIPRVIVIFLLGNLVLAALIAWALRHEGNFDTIPDGSGPGRFVRYGVRFLLEAFVRTIGLKQFGDDFRTTAARLLEVFMAVVGTVLSATIFGVLTSALVGSIGSSREVTVEDLSKLRVATLVDSTSQEFIQKLNIGPAGGAQGALPSTTAGPQILRCVPYEQAGDAAKCVTTKYWLQAMRIMSQGKVDGVLGDWVQLAYLSRLPEFEELVEVQGATFQLEPYGWGVSFQRPELLAQIDRALISRLRDRGWRDFVQRYLGAGKISPE